MVSSVCVCVCVYVCVRTQERERKQSVDIVNKKDRKAIQNITNKHSNGICNSSMEKYKVRPIKNGSSSQNWEVLTIGYQMAFPRCNMEKKTESSFFVIYAIGYKEGKR